MFVRSSTYSAMRERAVLAETQLDIMVRKWNRLVKRINLMGGESYLSRREQRRQQLSDEDIQRLLQLVHPDKHGGKQAAQEMTAKLLAMRGAR